MQERLPDGLYESLMTNELMTAIQSFEKATFAKQVTDEDLSDHLVLLLAKVLRERFDALKSQDSKVAFANEVLRLAGSSLSVVTEPQAKVLLGLIFNMKEVGGTGRIDVEPIVPLRSSALLTNDSQGLNVASQLRAELPSADEVCILMSFVKKAGIAHLEQQLRRLADANVTVRLITTAYMGATDADALDRLVNHLGVKVKVSDNLKNTRLHAKAWLIRRNSGFSTVFVGSSNLSDPALTTGAEWNVRLSQVSTPTIIEEFDVAFETYWNSKEYRTYKPERDREWLDEALMRANPSSKASGLASFLPSGLKVRAYPHQEIMLRDLEYSRKSLNLHKNLVVAATGTGKTVLAALDYLQLSKGSERPTLLFVAHTKEILQQALATYRVVLNDSTFGEEYVDGKSPKHWTHVFASIQSLTAGKIESLGKEQFKVVVIDEFHHAKAKTYRALIEHLSPKEMLGLTATPERGDKDKVQDLYFDGRIASELRLWDALDQGLLSGFDYFGIGESKDVVSYEDVVLSNGRYEPTSLSNVLTGNDARDRLLLNEIRAKVENPHAMRALVFCVDIKHSNHIAKMLQDKGGLKVKSVDGDSSSEERAKAIDDLNHGRIQAVTSVGVFNEGVDIPKVDTVIMLRPTESSVVFLQQLGRGLRRAEDKVSVTVLDFIGNHRKSFDTSVRYAALMGIRGKELERVIEDGFPALPSGVNLSLDSIAQQNVLENLKSQFGNSAKQLVQEAAELKPNTLVEYLDKTGRRLEDVLSQITWIELRHQAGLAGDEPSASQVQLARLARSIAHADDHKRISYYRDFLTQPARAWVSLAEETKRAAGMLFWALFPSAKDGHGKQFESFEAGLETLRRDSLVVSEFVEVLNAAESRVRMRTRKIKFSTADAPLRLHAHYTRNELLGALEWSRLDANPYGATKHKTRAAMGHQVGVEYFPEIDLDLFFINLLKEEAKFTESTRYKDWALSPNHFWWQSQSREDENGRNGKRYINQRSTKHDVLLAVREKSDGGKFMLLGLADYKRHKGNKPISILWKLRNEMPPEMFSAAAAVKVG
jgi:superfamily II DNA or RNA helicase